MKKILSSLSSLVFLTLFAMPVNAAPNIDYPDTVFASIDSSKLEYRIISGKEIEFTLTLQIRRNNNSILAIESDSLSGLPGKSAFEAPYDCEIISIGLGSFKKNETGRASSFISEKSVGDRVVEDHVITGSITRSSDKKIFCAGSVILSSVKITDVANHAVKYIGGKQGIAGGKAGEWYAYSDLWYNNPKIAPCPEVYQNSGWRLPCLNGDLRSSVVTIGQTEIDLATKLDQEQKEREEKQLSEVAQMQTQLLERIKSLVLKYPQEKPRLMITHFQLMQIGVKLETVVANKGQFAQISRQLDSLEARASAKSSTITCIKGKLTKKVTAVMPKCPTGYKQK